MLRILILKIYSGFLLYKNYAPHQIPKSEYTSKVQNRICETKKK